MIDKNLLLFAGIAALSVVISCDPFVPEFPEGATESFRPIYEDEADFEITRESGRSIGQAGKIYSYGDILLINEVNQGVHVIDNSDPTDPRNLFFISIPGNSDIAIHDGLVYANNMSDLAVINISDGDFQVVQRIESVFLEEDQQRYPPGNDVYFECVDPAKGRVVGWRSDIVEAPNCYKR